MIHKFDAHRVVALICRYPKHKWRFKVWQMLYLKQHVDTCFECQDKTAELSKRNPQVGKQSELN